jgi:hypothetical protein
MSAFSKLSEPMQQRLRILFAAKMPLVCTIPSRPLPKTDCKRWGSYLRIHGDTARAKAEASRDSLFGRDLFRTLIAYDRISGAHEEVSCKLQNKISAIARETRHLLWPRWVFALWREWKRDQVAIAPANLLSCTKWMPCLESCLKSN